jgi:hypothetical protein
VRVHHRDKRSCDCMLSSSVEQGDGKGDDNLIVVVMESYPYDDSKS